jgi:hypothetical protein
VTREQRRLAHAYAVRALRQLGRELATGEWRPGAEPIPVPQAAVVIGRAFMATMELGISNVLDALDERLSQFLR